MRKYVLLVAVLLTACAVAPQTVPNNASESTSSAVSVQYKRFSIGRISLEMPATWSTAYYGDVGEMPLPESSADALLSLPIVSFSIGKDGISRSEAFWSQTDFTMMTPVTMKQFIKNLHTYESDPPMISRWEETTIAGTPVTIAYGSEDERLKNPGAVMYFFTDIGEIMLKQSKGDNDYEKEYERIVQSIKLNASVFFGEDKE